MESNKFEKVIVKADYSRRFPDPLNVSEELNIEHHVILCRAIDLPSNISKRPNPREQNIDREVYKEIRESLDDKADNTFHLKNKGLTILAHKVDYSEDKKMVTIHLGPEDGIVDGGHTYEIIMRSKQANTCPDNQYLKMEVLTGIPKGSDMRVDITAGLNTAVQVQESSLANLQGSFDWIKDLLKDAPYAGEIAYRENEDKEVEIREIISLMTLFNLKYYPDGTKHPKEAYISKAKCLEMFKSDPESYKKAAGILKDILYLRDYVSVKSRDIYNGQKGGNALKMVGVYDSKERGVYRYVFMNEEHKHKMYDAALYPMLGALRFLVEERDGMYAWKPGGLEKVKAFFETVAAELVSITYETSLKFGRKPNAIGKDENHWNLIYKTVALAMLQQKA